MTKTDFGGIAIELPDGWSQIDEDGGPYTLARTESGRGTLQLSPALFETGRKPDPTANDLLEFAIALASKHNLGEPFDVRLAAGRLRIAGASFRSGDDFTRIWYVSDGWSIALVTYSGEWGQREAELGDCEQIVCSIEFYAPRETPT